MSRDRPAPEPARLSPSRAGGVILALAGGLWLAIGAALLLALG